jgi:ribosomal protein S18 acetylase RimI-like enzyme
MVQIKYIIPEETYEIRKKILRKNMDLPAQFHGDFEKESFHLGLFEDNKLVSISSFVRANNDNFEGIQYQLRGMATLEEFQGNGYGKALVLEAEKILKEKKIAILWCNARVSAAHFYYKQGFKSIGQEFDIPQIGGHYVMFKNLV